MITFNPQKLKLEILRECPICGCMNIPVKVISYWYLMLINYCQCKECGTLFLNPRMTDKQTEKYYKGTYRNIISKGNIQGDIKWENLRAKYQFGLIKSFIFSVRTNLEIGSSTGALMEQLKERNIKSIGIEPEKSYWNLDSEEIDLVYGDIIDVTPNPFDLITSSHSIEHLNHPVEYFDNLVKNYSHEKTIFMVETPNTDVYRCFSMHHPFAFTTATLDGLFARIGLKPIKHFYHNLGRSESKKYLLALYKKEIL